ncbi:MAG: methyltransferase domain-containing protein [Oscillospiraceae bacterium]|nr:methyltransferase domain-containing protein [Oscillospiraceae bacterium]
MSSYTSLAECYDQFTQDVKYKKWADYLTGLFKSFSDGEGTHQVLDLACGTGSLSLILAERGYEVIGTDASEDMLSVAQSKAWSGAFTPPMFLHQRMEELDLYGTVDAAVCCLDSLNYLTDIDALKQAFLRLRYFVRPGGLFIFDVNTHAKFLRLDGCAFLRENEDFFCAWSAEYDEPKRLCTFFYDIFKSAGNLWERSFEEHTERAHSHDEIEAALNAAEFDIEAIFGELSTSPPKDDEQRIFYVARRR